MFKDEVLKKLLLPEYRFLTTDRHLNDNTDTNYNYYNIGNRILMLGFGGSHAYGTSTETSDIDIRGCAIPSKQDILLMKDFGQVTDEATDTVIYSIHKLFHLMAQCNPNTIEILGLEEDGIIYEHPLWKRIRNNANLFLSKRCIHTFGGYANSQLRRLETKSARENGQAQREQYILGSIKNGEKTFKENYQRMPDDAMKLYIDKSEKEDFDTEIMVDLNVTHYPMRDLTNLMNDYHSIVRDYDKIGKRNSKAIEHSKLGKHMMHLVRLYFMVFDILEKEEIHTYRKEEHDLLMDIRNGHFLKDGITPTEEFYKLLDDLDKRFEEAKYTTKLPDTPDMTAINKLLTDTICRYYP